MAGRVLGIEAAEAHAALEAARERVKQMASATSSYLIEDEPIIAMDLSTFSSSAAATA